MKRNNLLIFIFILLFTAYGSLITRCFFLQHTKSEFFSSLSKRQRERIIIERPRRGTILDRNGRILAASNKQMDIFVDPQFISDPEKVAVLLAPVLKTEAFDILEQIKKNSQKSFLPLLKNADPCQCEMVANIKGAGIQHRWQRYYPFKNTFCHVLGFTGYEGNGFEGIELKYDSKLTGQKGSDQYVADVLRRPIKFKQNPVMVKDGCGIVLTVDSAIQKFAHDEIANAIKEYNAESATAIIADPKTGAILAMVSMPDYDPEKIIGTDPNLFKNHAVSDQFEPGSILKPIAAAIALDSGKVTTTEKIFCENGTYVGKGFGRITEYDYHKYGDMTVKEIIEQSSNIGMAKIGQRIGAETLYNGLLHFGFRKQTGIDLPAEAEGMMRTQQKWDGYSITRIPFGQEISVTSVQMIQAFCILANGGYFVKPYIVSAIVDNEGKVIDLKQPAQKVGYVVKPEVAKWITQVAMAGVINNGTGDKAKLDNWKIFGKTGTAQLAGLGGIGYSDTDYVASFIAGGPVEDPVVVVLVSITKPDRSLGKGYSGGRVAAPVAGKIIEKTLNYLKNQGN